MNSVSAIQTMSGSYFDILDPRAEDVKVDDIVHALSHVCRFAGHTKTFWSVADHSLLVADLCGVIQGSTVSEQAALFHDAAEAFLGDMPRPIKYANGLGEIFRQIEHNVSNVIADALGFERGYDKAPVIKLADRCALAIEATYLMNQEPWVIELIEHLGIETLVATMKPRFNRPADIVATQLAFK